MPPKVKFVIPVAIIGYAQKLDTVHNRNFTLFPAYLKNFFNIKQNIILKRLNLKLKSLSMNMTKSFCDY